jgi:hypothetical protein
VYVVVHSMPDSVHVLKTALIALLIRKYTLKRATASAPTPAPTSSTVRTEKDDGANGDLEQGGSVAESESTLDGRTSEGMVGQHHINGTTHKHEHEIRIKTGDSDERLRAV